MSGAGRAIEDSDRARVLSTSAKWASSGDFNALRTHALVLLAWGSALRLKEAIALDLDQVLEDPTSEKIGRLRASAFVRPEQSKGSRKGKSTWTSAGLFLITKQARAALRAYLEECIKRGWLTLPAPKGTPLFITIKGGRTKGALSRQRLSKRAAQHTWGQLQLRAGIATAYNFQDLRHDSLTRIGEASDGNVFRVAQFGRLKDIRTAQHFVRGSTATVAELGELAAADHPRRARKAR